MPLSQLSSKHVPVFHEFLDGTIASICGMCYMRGPNVSKDQDLARVLFWAKHDYLWQAKPAEEAPMTSEYRRGVEDATAEAQYAEINALPVTSGFNSGVLRTFLQNRRKSLLSKKVTKWVIIFVGEEKSLFPDFKLWNSKDLADQTYKECANYRGAYPIEIEVPID